jgi:hypothetical protein
MTVPTTACLVFLAAQFASAQVDTLRPRRHELMLVAGVSDGQRLDATASPLQFGGLGSSAVVAYTSTYDRTAVGASIDGAQRHLSVINGAATASELLSETNAQATWTRRWESPARRGAFSVGADLTASLAVTHHTYTDPAKTASDFALGLVTLGPIVGWSQSIGRGAAQVDVATPLVGVIDHPYSDIRINDGSVRTVRVANVATIHGLSGALTYAVAARDRLSVLCTYRVRLLHVADVQPLRSVSQTFGVGIVTRWGEGRIRP